MQHWKRGNWIHFPVHMFNAYKVLKLFSILSINISMFDIVYDIGIDNCLFLPNSEQMGV